MKGILCYAVNIYNPKHFKPWKKGEGAQVPSLDLRLVINTCISLLSFVVLTCFVVYLESFLRVQSAIFTYTLFFSI